MLITLEEELTVTEELLGALEDDVLLDNDELPGSTVPPQAVNTRALTTINPPRTERVKNENEGQTPQDSCLTIVDSNAR
jgi:hypothetical protein